MILKQKQGGKRKEFELLNKEAFDVLKANYYVAGI